MVMFDSLNRHMLPPYGCDWVRAPNFQRLAERAVTFDTSYVCSMPCMPARRDMHTGRPGFLHRSWGPLEPFDDSVPEILKKARVHTHLATDHYHYFEEGGTNYHTKYTTWEFFRGQEGDPWIGQVEPIPIPGNATGRHAKDDFYPIQDMKNRSAMQDEEQHMQSQTFRAGLDFIERNVEADNWFLQIETFDPHEPYFSYQKYKDLYPDHYDNYKGSHFDWPLYKSVENTREEIEHLVHENAALISMCDAKLGEVLDAMDKHDLWDDTLLIVWTDHGFLLGEHDSTGKCWCPFYEEIARTPFFIWDPRSCIRGERRQSLVQPSIDLGPTLLDFFGMQPAKDMLGRNLAPVIKDDAEVRNAAIFGMHGHQVNITDGRYVYMRGPKDESNQPLFEYTLSPSHMRNVFSPEELRRAVGLAESRSFTKGCQTLKIPSVGSMPGNEKVPMQRDTALYDLEADPKQIAPIKNKDVENRLTAQLIELMKECDAPDEQFERMGLPRP